MRGVRYDGTLDHLIVATGWTTCYNFDSEKTRSATFALQNDGTDRTDWKTCCGWHVLRLVLLRIAGSGSKTCRIDWTTSLEIAAAVVVVAAAFVAQVVVHSAAGAVPVMIAAAVPVIVVGITSAQELNVAAQVLLVGEVEETEAGAAPAPALLLAADKHTFVAVAVAAPEKLVAVVDVVEAAARSIPAVAVVALVAAVLALVPVLEVVAALEADIAVALLEQSSAVLVPLAVVHIDSADPGSH